ncbi:DUF2804 domain-containing protein [Leptospira wolffii]|uniref:DUF2804 domain-containing protein n=1 Tax=Leptospira wolffii TaxID=409998 RepID=UPI0010836D47|nr:DUF2804 domain-containing protein [Leptospira wolffii]TGK58303.1 DUF2804 domain-containing protein [Leptospira wolffii]TGK66320.1 DUF2804 domain-containing protein [Leptospira wolffii]TGK68981.1 DUF2804 domain-containing protein [Leptospira wolffii]TGL27333.1 DUF2804 domain-containing protein [Leptospira wolffii]
MKEHLGSILHTSTLEPMFGTYFGPVQIDNSREYKSGPLSWFRSVDSVLVDIWNDSVFLELRIFRNRFRSGARLLLWNRKSDTFQELNVEENGTSSFLKQGSFKDGYWSFSKGEKRFNFRLDDTIRQGYTHSAIWAKDLNFQLDALVNTGDPNRTRPLTQINPSHGDWFFLNRSPQLELEGQLSWNDLSTNFQNDSIAYSVSKGFSSEAFPLESRIYLTIGKKKAQIYLGETPVLWKDGEAKILEIPKEISNGKTKSFKSSQFELVLEPEFEASFLRPKTWGKDHFKKSLYTVSGWIKTKQKKEKVTGGIAILEVPISQQT